MNAWLVLFLACAVGAIALAGYCIALIASSPRPPVVEMVVSPVAAPPPAVLSRLPPPPREFSEEDAPTTLARRPFHPAHQPKTVVRDVIAYRPTRTA